MKLVILDRDGVINEESADFIKSVAEWTPIPGSLEAIARLCHAGYRVYVASNQSGIGRGLYDRAALEAIHRKMRRAVSKAGGAIDRIVTCPHRPEDACECRKPAPGLLRRLAKHYGLSMRGIPVIGDSARDLEAAHAVEARPMLVLTGNGQRTRETQLARDWRVETFENLLGAARALVAEQERERR